MDTNLLNENFFMQLKKVHLKFEPFRKLFTLVGTNDECMNVGWVWPIFLTYYESICHPRERLPLHSDDLLGLGA